MADMINFRLSGAMAKKIKESPTAPPPADVPPLCDWAAHVFRVGRYQYVLVTNPVTLFSLVIHGAGISDSAQFIDIVLENLVEVFRMYGFDKAFSRDIAPRTGVFNFTKIGDPSLTGCMNGMVPSLKYWLGDGLTSPMDVHPRLNEIPFNRKGQSMVVGRKEMSKLISISDTKLPSAWPSLPMSSIGTNHPPGWRMVGKEDAPPPAPPPADVSPPSSPPPSREPGAMVAGAIPLTVPEIRGNEWRYLKECLDTGWVSSAGSFVTRFEQDMATRLGASHAVAVATGTAALHLALQVTGVGPDDEVIVPTLTFVATANAVRYCGAWPVLLDVDPDHWQLDPAAVTAFLRENCELRDGRTINRTSGRAVKAIIPVDLLGHPVDADPLLAIAREFSLTVIEDATESLGAEYRGHPAGTLGDIACLSFNGNKLITTGGGGMILTERQDWAERARYLSTQAKDDPVEYLHREIGYNYRLTNLQAAMGCAQLEQIEAFLAAKRTIAERYQAAFADMPGFSLQAEARWARSACWLPTVRIDPQCAGIGSRDLMRHLEACRIQTRPLWIPLHRLPPYANCQAWQIHHADRLQQQCLSLPSSVGLSRQDQEKVIGEIRKTVRN